MKHFTDVSIVMILILVGSSVALQAIFDFV